MTTRQSFDGAAAGFMALVARVPGDAWERPALGVWDVRALAGHTSRALTTIEAYLGGLSEGPPVGSPVDYYLKVMPRPPAPGSYAADAAIAERGRAAGEALGPDPAAAVATLASRVRALVARTPDDAPVASPAGPMTLAAYLPTRTFELTVHSLDLARAVGAELPPELGPAVTACCELAGAIAGRRPDAANLLLLVTGRDPRAPDATVL